MSMLPLKYAPSSMLMPAALMSPIKLPCSRIAIFSVTTTLPRTFPKIATSRALISPSTFPFGPTVSRLCDSNSPSTSPSTSSSSRARISPLIVIEGPITADCLDPLVVDTGAAGAIGAGAIGVGAIGVGSGPRTGPPCGLKVVGSSFRLFHILGIPSIQLRLIRQSEHLEGQLLYLCRLQVRGAIRVTFTCEFFRTMLFARCFSMDGGALHYRQSDLSGIFL